MHADSIVRIYVNESPERATAGSSMRDAIRAARPDLAEPIVRGHAYLTDGVGRKIDPACPVFDGAIVRVVVTAQ